MIAGAAGPAAAPAPAPGRRSAPPAACVRATMRRLCRRPARAGADPVQPRRSGALHPQPGGRPEARAAQDPVLRVQAQPQEGHQGAAWARGLGLGWGWGWQLDMHKGGRMKWCWCSRGACACECWSGLIRSGRAPGLGLPALCTRMRASGAHADQPPAPFGKPHATAGRAAGGLRVGAQRVPPRRDVAAADHHRPRAGAPGAAHSVGCWEGHARQGVCVVDGARHSLESPPIPHLVLPAKCTTFPHVHRAGLCGLQQHQPADALGPVWYSPAGRQGRRQREVGAAGSSVGTGCTRSVEQQAAATGGPRRPLLQAAGSPAITARSPPRTIPPGTCPRPSGTCTRASRR